jgi:hypothetical protein
MSARFLENPFYVLGLPTDAPQTVVEREGQKLLGMLALGLKSAATYATPAGPGERTEDKVRSAMAELRDPNRRLSHELWARVAPPTRATDEVDDARPASAAAPWASALEDLGWRRA